MGSSDQFMTLKYGYDGFYEVNVNFIVYLPLKALLKFYCCNTQLKIQAKALMTRIAYVVNGSWLTLLKFIKFIPIHSTYSKINNASGYVLGTSLQLELFLMESIHFNSGNIGPAKNTGRK